MLDPGILQSQAKATSQQTIANHNLTTSALHFSHNCIEQCCLPSTDWTNDPNKSSLQKTVSNYGAKTRECALCTTLHYCLDLNEARDGGVLGCSGINWTICKQSALHSRQKTTPTPHHSIFAGRMLFLTPNQQRQSTEGIALCSTLGRQVNMCDESKMVI